MVADVEIEGRQSQGNNQTSNMTEAPYNFTFLKRDYVRAERVEYLQSIPNLEWSPY